MMRVFNGLLLFFLLYCLPLKPQAGPTSNWYFGNLAGITFNSGAPVALTNGALSTSEGVATISDNSGNLLFYTNGLTVWNRNHLIMTNGTGLLGDASTTQSAIIVQKPLSSNIYYIFTADNNAGPDGINYSEVDMNLSSGLGSVTATKNVLLHTPSSEKLCAVRHCNNRDIWVISRDWNSNVFRCWLVDPSGVGNSISWSIAGPMLTGNNTSTLGQLKASLDGRKLAACYYGFSGSGLSIVQIYDFDASTGFVTNAQTISTDLGVYGCEFSPNGRLLYVSTNQGLLLQYNLCAGTTTQISNSRTLIFNSGPFMGSLQLGPNGRIYLARGTSPFLSVINSPNTLGSGCNYVNNSINLLGRNGNFGLPNFASFYVPSQTSINYTSVCNLFQFNTLNIPQSCTSQTYNYLWNLGDGTQSNSPTPQHFYTSPGTYNVTLTMSSGCSTITSSTTVVVSSGIFVGPIQHN